MSSIPPGGPPLHPHSLKLNKALITQATNTNSENNTIMDTISSNESRQYFYNSPQLGFKMGNTSGAKNLPPMHLSGGGLDYAKPSISSPANTAYFRESTLKHSYEDNFQNEQITPNSLDYSASAEHQRNRFTAFQGQKSGMGEDLQNIRSKHDILMKAYPYQYENPKLATLGQEKDEELESTVFGQSSINPATFNEGTSRMSDDQNYFGNMKAAQMMPDSLAMTGNRPPVGSNFNTISSSAESTPNKAFKANLLAKQRNFGGLGMTGLTHESQESIYSSQEGGLTAQHQIFKIPEPQVDNKMDAEKAPFYTKVNGINRLEFPLPMNYLV